MFETTSEGSLPIVTYDADTGRWPTRVRSDPVVWVDDTGAAPKPPMTAGDVYLQAALTLAGTSSTPAGSFGSVVKGELLASTMRTFGVPWDAHGSAAQLSDGGATLAKEGDALSLGNVSVPAGRHVTFAVYCAEGSVALSMEFWHQSKQFKTVSNGGGPGEVVVSSDVPSGASVANLWVNFSGRAATVTTAQLVQGA